MNYNIAKRLMVCLAGIALAATFCNAVAGTTGCHPQPDCEDDPVFIYDAQFVSQTVPTTMMAGVVYPVTVKMKNIGNTTWIASNFGIASRNPAGNTTWGVQKVLVPAAIAPGVTATFSFNITAPATSGTYNFQWQMERGAAPPFGIYTPNVAITVKVNNASFVSQSIPAVMYDAVSQAINVKMTNTGTTTWTAATNYKLALLSPANPAAWGITNRLPLTASIAPGQTATFAVNVTPSVVGSSNFQWRMVQDGVAVFGASSPSAPVQVKPTPLAGIRTAYDALGRVVSIKQDSELGVLTTTMAYLAGFQTQVTNPRGFQTLTSYMAYDQPSTDLPIGITHPEGAYTRIFRDDFGKPTAITRHNLDNSDWNTRYYAYDQYQQLCKTTEVETGTTALGYDAAGNLIWSAASQPWSPYAPCEFTANSASVAPVRVDRTYDVRNRLQTLVFPDGRGDQAWTYTADGLPEQITAYNAPAQGQPVITSYAYNKRRLLTGENMTTSAPAPYSSSIGYGYDANGNLTNQVYPSGFQANYSPNAVGWPTHVNTYAFSIYYHANGAMARFTYGNWMMHTMSQNVRGLPDTSCDFVQASNCTAAAALYDGYDYDANGNVAAISDGRTLNRGNRTMTYDGLDRLKTVVSPMFANASYSYDTLDNLTRVNIGGTAARDHYYCYDAHNQLTNVKTGSCEGVSVIGLGYDVRGNLANKNGQLFDFDIGNRLREAVGQEAYQYDALGRRVTATAANGTIYSHYSRAGQLLQQKNERSASTLQYLYLNGSLVTTLEQPDGGVVTAKYQHTDALGSPVAVTDANQVIIEKNEYEPFGKVINHPLKDGPGYTGHVADAATGMNYMQQRYYDPAIGRPISVDPVTAFDSGDWRFFNRYAYAFNSPYSFKDPDGRCPNCVTGGIGAGIGLLVGLGIEGYRQYRAGEFNGRSLLVEGGKGAVVGGLIGLTGGAAAASGLTLSGQAVATGSVALGVGAGAHAVGEVAKGNPAPSASDSIKVGYATAAGAIAGTALSPATKSMTTTVIPAVSSHPVTSLSGKTFNTVNIPALTIERPAAAEVANNVAGSVVEDLAKKREEGQ